MKTLVILQTGKGRKRDGRTRSRTSAQRRSRGNLSRFSRMWNELTEARRTAWWHAARFHHRRGRRGRFNRPDGKRLFTRINLVLSLLGREPVLDPPPRPFFPLIPVFALRITLVNGRPVLKLALKETPVHEIMVFASPPQNPGRRHCRDYRFLGLLPASVEYASDITRLYLKKYGALPLNKRVFIRTWQHANGWEDQGGMMLADALVPAKAGAAKGSCAARARAGVEKE